MTEDITPQERDYRRAVKRRKRKRTWGNIALHWLPFLMMFVAVIAGAAYADHNAQVRENDRDESIRRECVVLVHAVRANRDALKSFVIRLTTAPNDATAAEKQRFEQQQARLLAELGLVFDTQPLPDCRADH